MMDRETDYPRAPGLSCDDAFLEFNSQHPHKNPGERDIRLQFYNSGAGEVEAGGSGIVQRSDRNCSRFREVTEVTDGSPSLHMQVPACSCAPRHTRTQTQPMNTQNIE